MTIEEYISGEIQYYDSANAQWVTYANGVLSDANVISASVKRQCCEDGKFTIGGVFAATMQLVCKLSGLTRYQLGNARIVLKSQYAGEAQPVPLGTFWATHVSRVRDIFTIRGMDAMGWLDVLVSEYEDIVTGGATYHVPYLVDRIFWDENGNQYVGYLIEYVFSRLIGKTALKLTDKTGLSALLSVQPYSASDNCGVTYSNRYHTNYPNPMWQDDGTTGQAFFRSDKDKNYKCNKPRDVLRWCAELFGGFITVNRNGAFEMRQFCQPSLNIAVVSDADTEADSLEIAEYYMYPRTISASGQSHQNLYDTVWDYSITDSYVEPEFTGYDIRIENNILADGVGPYYPEGGGSSLQDAVYSFICGLFQAFVRYEDIDYNWETKTPFPKDQSVTEHIGLFKAYPVPFKCKVHKPERYELGQTIVFTDHPNTFSNYRYGYASYVPYLRSVITSIEWTFRGGQVLSCGEGNTRSMMQLSQDSKADAVLRELRNRV